MYSEFKSTLHLNSAVFAERGLEIFLSQVPQTPISKESTTKTWENSMWYRIAYKVQGTEELHFVDLEITDKLTRRFVKTKLQALVIAETGNMAKVLGWSPYEDED